jgi:hypothetical protein
MGQRNLCGTPLKILAFSVRLWLWGFIFEGKATFEKVHRGQSSYNYKVTFWNAIESAGM